MANLKHAKKMIRKTASKSEVNKRRKSRVRSFYKRVEEAIAAGDKTKATSELRLADKQGQKFASKGMAHKKTVARKISRLAKKVAALS